VQCTVGWDGEAEVTSSSPGDRTSPAPLSERIHDRLFALPQGLAAHAGYGEALAALAAGKHAEFDGVHGSACALLAANLQTHAPGTLAVICSSADEMDEFAEDMKLFSRLPVRCFPPWETDPAEKVPLDEIHGARLAALNELRSAAKTGEVTAIVACCIQSLLQPVPSPSALEATSRQIEVGATLDVETLSQWLVEQGFHHTSAVEMPGEFSLRGGILDIFAGDWVSPIRFELFGDDVESIRRFDVASQRSLETLERVELTILTAVGREGACLIDYLPDTSWYLLVEPEKVVQQGKQYLDRLEQVDRVLGFGEVMARIQHAPLASVSALAGGASCRLGMESVERFSGEIGRVREELDRIATDHDVYVVAHTESEVERLGDLLAATQAAASGRLYFHIGSIREGFRLVEDQVLVIAASQLFARGQLRRPTPRRQMGKAIDSFMELGVGDLVVHLAHGIGRYRGLKRLDRNDQVEEHLEVEFAGGTRVYVPAARIGLVHKYIGGTRSRPALARIGGKTWQRQKQAAAMAATDLAAELLDLQAARMARPGISFAGDSDWQREFDASFPYQETPDQLAAAESIRFDMENVRPMDRLVCGDVGYGKTELAMRAAFKAVDNGYQVAVLVPTTILAEQHYRTFRDRMSEFPFDIARLSRFCSAGEQREIVEALEAGQVDIVIGTHRIGSKDLKFYNLGLVIIDEEQRFGVAVKERLKTFRATVDVMTMSATPIPRTLHMSLVGVRDISNLQTAPEDRIAVETRVVRWDEDLIRRAVLRELNRGGQIYFVHNRVNDIHLVREKLKRIVPEASVQIGHGQMPETELEQVMVDFVTHRFDLLLATTIVESGLDIPNANTIFIDEADRYGLADLHQLRGRVGRYKHRAYSYLLVDSRKPLTPNASRRLRAIEEFSEMGAGFSIAMRDLEIRGAGNLLGTQQSGHIAMVGYELYCQLLETAVGALKQAPPPETIDVEIDLPGASYLPDDYVPDIRLKIDFYRRLARISDTAELETYQEELVDRFGSPPPPVMRLVQLAELRIAAARWQITAIRHEDRFLRFSCADSGQLRRLAKTTLADFRIVDAGSAYVPLKKEVTDSVALFDLAKSVLPQG